MNSIIAKLFLSRKLGLAYQFLYAILRIFAAADAPIDWEPVDVSPVKHADGTMGIPRAAIDSVNKNKVQNLKIYVKINVVALFCSECQLLIWYSIYVQLQVGLKSPLMTPVGKGFRSLNLALRKEFSL